VGAGALGQSVSRPLRVGDAAVDAKGSHLFASAGLYALHVAIAGSILLIACLPLKVKLVHLLYDDYFYYLQVARHMMAEGKLSFDGTALTWIPHPLWLLVCAGALRLGGENLAVHLPIVLAGVLHLVQAFLVFKILGAMCSRRLAHLGAVFYMLNYRILACNLSGLETPLQLVILLAVLLLLTCHRHPLSLRASLGWGLLLALGTLARTDMILLAGVVPCWVLIDSNFGSSFWKRRLPTGVMMVLIVLVVLTPWYIFCAAHTGMLIPSTFEALSTFRFERFDYGKPLVYNLAILKTKLLASSWYYADTANLMGLWPRVRPPYLGGGLGGGLMLLILGVLIACACRRRRDDRRPMLIGLTLYGGLHFAYYTLMAHPELRYLLPFSIVTILVVLISVGHARTEGSRRRRLAVAWVAGGVLLFNSLASGADAWLHNQGATTTHALHGGLHDMAQWISRHTAPDTVVGAWNSGILGFYSGRTVVNLDGLVNVDAVRAMRARALSAYLDQRRVQYLVDLPWQIRMFMDRFAGRADWGKNLELVHSESAVVALRRRSSPQIAGGAEPAGRSLGPP